MVPCVQVFEHSLQLFQLESAQSTGQQCTLQGRASARLGHAVPPWADERLIARERDCVPPPHEIVHVAQVVQELTSQSTGQLSELHERSSARYGHA